MVVCEPALVWPLSRRGRELVQWDVAGLPGGAVVFARLEDSNTWSDVLISTDRLLLSMWAVGPDFPDPGDALLVPTTSRVEMRVVDGQLTTFLDGGYIELIP